MSARELNPATSSATNSQALETARELGTCSDGKKCGVPPNVGDDAYCVDCPNWKDSALKYSPEEVAFKRDEDAGLDKRAGMKFDTEKPRFDLLFADMPLALEAVARVLTFGAAKYADGNWVHVENAERRYLAASMRHEIALAKGEQHDPETGEHHLAHKLCCELFRLELALREGVL